MAGRSQARLVRFGIFALLLILCGYILSRGAHSTNSGVIDKGASKSASAGNSVPAAAGGAAADNSKAQQSLQDNSKTSQGENQGVVTDETTGWIKDYSGSTRQKATFVTLARNSDLWEVVGSIRQVEDRFNRKFKYDWVFLNDEEFSEEFKKVTSALVSGLAKYGKIPKEHWSFPEWIDVERAAKVREEMREQKIIYGDSISYRHMCRFESGFFWRQDLLKDYEWYWRVEPGIKIFCDVEYDLFKFMVDNNKKYSFTVSLPEYPATIPTLWQTVREFIKENPQYIPEDNMMDFISDDGGLTYNGCHFWSNFEVASLDFWRSELYQKFFEYLDKAGGFFYERWGDAPVHSIAAALFLPRDQIHFFEDVGYFHIPFNNCPIDETVRLQKRCMCPKNEDFTWRGYSCVPKFFTVNNLKRPSGWENYS